MTETKMPCSDCELFFSDHLGKVDEGLLKLLDQEGHVYSYEPGQVIFHEGTPSFAMYCLRSGLVKTYRKASGGDHLIKILGSGDAFGYPDVLSGGSYHVTAEAIVESEVCTIPGQILLDMLEQSLPLAFELLSRLSREIRTYQDQLTMLSQGSVKHRIIGIILTLAERCGEDADGGLVIHLPIHQKQMAQMVGIAPESLSRTLRSLAEEGYIALAQKTITIKDLPTLAGLVKG